MRGVPTPERKVPPFPTLTEALHTFSEIGFSVFLNAMHCDIISA